MRRMLDLTYWLASWAAGLCLFIIMALVAVQLGARILDGALGLAGLPRTGLVILSLAEICGYLLASASFLALAPTLKAGAHVRVTMGLAALGEKWRRPVELAVLAASAVFVAFLTWSVGRMTLDSWLFNEISTGLIPVPLAWPQAAMTLGLVVLVISLLDECVTIAIGGRPTFRAAEDAITLGKEG